MSNLIATIKKVIDPLKRRVFLSLGRAIINAVDDGKGVQLVQASLLAGEVQENVERFQEFGFTSHPPNDTEAAAIFIGGNREHGIVVGCEHRKSRLKLKGKIVQGEMAIYSEDGNFLAVKKDGKIVIKNENEELISLGSDLIQSIIDARTFTLLGLQPLISFPPNDPFPVTKTKWDTFKE